MNVNTTNTTAKKRILALALALILLLLALTRVTLSYFTDTKKATNTFTYGNVSITQWENCTDTNESWTQFGIAFTNFLPIGTTSTDINAIRAANNYNTKRVMVRNDSSSSSVYVRTFVRVRKELVVSSSTPNYQLLHLDFNSGTRWQYTGTYEETIANNPYQVYLYTYSASLPKDAKTDELLNGVYLDPNADIRAVNGHDKLVYVQGNEIKHDSGLDVYDDAGDPNSIQVDVATQAVQADGFTGDTAIADAFNAAFGRNDPWGGTF